MNPGRKTAAPRSLRDRPLPGSSEKAFEAITIAAQYGLFDLERLENLILRKLAPEYFQILP
jgi:hypothetical protein